MSRVLCILSAALLAVLILTSFSTAAQDSTQQQVTPGKRIVRPSFQLEVLVDGRPLSEYYSRGDTYVEAFDGAEYELRLRNSSPDRVAVALSVDGLNTIDADRSSAWNGSKWVIEPYQTITISGWQTNTERARRFYFTSERDSYAAKLGQRSEIGLISAVFFRERSRPVPITRARPQPADAAKSSQAGVLREERAATGAGRSVDNEVCLIDMDLDSRPVAEVRVRYEWGRRPICGSNPRCRADNRRDN
jgi:hypothetical protein